MHPPKTGFERRDCRSLVERERAIVMKRTL
jgi:hypothetical protein